MQNCKKRVLYALLVCAMIFMQLSGPLAVLADSKTPLKVTDVGDKNLYAYLAAYVDKSSDSNGGILYKEDAEKMTSLNLNSTKGDLSIFSLLKEVSSFENLATLCPNLTSFSTDGGKISEEAFSSLVDEIVKMDKLTSLTFVESAATSEDVKKFATKTNADKLTRFSFSVNDEFDCSILEGLTNLNKITIRTETKASLKNIEAVKKLSNVTNVSITSYAKAEVQGLLDNFSEQVQYVNIHVYDSSAKTETYDVSKFTQAKDIYFYGNAKQITGFSAIANLNNVHIGNRDSNSKILVDMNELPEAVRSISFTGCDLGTKVLEKLPQQVKNVNLKNCGLQSIGDLAVYPNLNSLELDSNELQDVATLENMASLSMLSLEQNKLTSIPDLSKNTSLNSIYVDNNALTDLTFLANNVKLNTITAAHNQIQNLPDLSKMEKLNRLQLAYNEISTLPDLSKLKGLEGYYRYGSASDKDSSFTQDNCYNLSLKANKLTKDAIKGKVPEACENNQYWVYAATMLQTANGKAYFPDINIEIVSKIASGENTPTIYMNKPEFELSEELVQYLKDNKKGIYLTYVNDIFEQSVHISGESLEDTTKTISLHYQNVSVGTSTEELNHVFEPYGVVAKYYTVQGEAANDVNGVNYYDVEVQNRGLKLEENQAYNIYNYNADNKTFVYAGYLKQNAKYVSDSYGRYGDDVRTRVYVKADTDKVIARDEYEVKTSDSTYTTTTSYYKMLDATILRGLLAENSYRNVNVTTDANFVELSEEMRTLLKEQNKYLNVNFYDKDRHHVYIRSTVAPENKNAVTIKRLELAIANENAAIVSPAGAVIKYFKVGEIADNIAGVSYTLDMYESDGISKRYYAWFNGKAISLTNSDIRLHAGRQNEFFTVDLNNDELVKKQTVEVNGKNLTYTYLTDISAEYLDAYVDYIAKNGAEDVRVINTIEDKITFSAKSAAMLKNGQSDMSDVSFVNSETAKRDGYVNIYDRELLQLDNNGALTLEKPQVEITTGNEAFEKVFTPGTTAIYVTPKMAIKSGVSYFLSRYSYTDKLDNTARYWTFQLDDGKLLNTGRLYNELNVSRPTALIKESDYETPSDTPEEPTQVTPSDTPEQPTQVTPSDTPEQPTQVTPSDTPEQPTTEAATEKATEAEAVTEPTTKATDVEVVTEPTQKETEVEVVTEPTQKETEVEVVTEPTQKETEVVAPQPTAQRGAYSVARTVAEDKLVNAGSVNSALEDRLTNSELASLDITSKGAAPMLSSDVFSKMKNTRKNVTVGVTDENNRLQYSWTFNGSAIGDANMNLDLSISFDTDRADRVKEITGRDDVMYLSFAHHGQLPAPATIKTYVGNQYKNGDIVFLYYYNEETNKVETVGGRQGLEVKEGYVEYTITHCSLYFLSQEPAEALNAINPEDNSLVVQDIPVTVDDTNVPAIVASAQTGDNAHVGLYVLAFVVAAAVVCAVVVMEKKKKTK